MLTILASHSGSYIFGQHLASKQTRSCCLQRSQQRASVLAEAKPTKAADLRGLSEEEISKQIEEGQRTLLEIRFAQRRRKAFKPDQVGWTRNKIAQLKTILREREIEQNVSSRESRKLEKQKKLAAGFGQF